MHSPELSRPDTAPANTLTGTAGEAVAHYLNAQAADFLRSLRRHDENGAESARALRAAARRIGGTLHTFRPLLDPAWADGLRAELAWLSTTLAQEHDCTSRLSRILDALSRLSGTTPLPPARGESCPLPGSGTAGGEGDTDGATTVNGTADATTVNGTADATREAAGRGGSRTGGRAGATAASGALAVGAARAGALLERQITLARTRAHSAALQALGSSRFHAVADAVALLASELPLGPAAAGPAAETLALPAAAAERRLLEAVAELPLGRAAHPYNAEALFSGLAAASAGEEQDAPWHEVRRLLQLHRYAQEVLHPTADPVLCHAGLLLDRHRDAAEAAAAAATAARTPRIAPATAYALGVLHADQRHEVEAARFAFQQEWRHADTHAPVHAGANGVTAVTAVTAP
ncbi:CHAD domain-containing protein [Streptomyces sp. NPDC003023]|uniref:CHAD domain-containing protein n=1 Tax=Streptomyces sp. NPDC003023 TaxID=3364675 RepID=UPI003676EA7C